MLQLKKDCLCLLCGKQLKKGSEIRGDWVNFKYYAFCPKHKTINLKSLAIALLKYRNVNEKGLPIVPLEICEYRILIEEGVI